MIGVNPFTALFRITPFVLSTHFSIAFFITTSSFTSFLLYSNQMSKIGRAIVKIFFALSVQCTLNLIKKI